MRKLLLLLFAIAPLQAVTVVTFTAPGSGTWTAPSGVTTVKVECWGGGGGGASTLGATQQGGGGGGGGYAVRNTMAVTPGTVYSYTVGDGAVGNATAGFTQGIASVFTGNSSVKCQATGGFSPIGGSPSQGGGGSFTDGDAGFNGGLGNFGSNAGGGGGGGSAGSATSGNTGGQPTGATAVTGGGPGGDGGSPASSNDGNTPASGPSGGGGGAFSPALGFARTGGSGHAGQIKLTFTPAFGTKSSNSFVF